MSENMNTSNNSLKLSIIVCAYNESDTISQCLSGLLNQTLDKEVYEVIVIDDGSSDNTVNLVTDFISTAEPSLNIKLICALHGGLSRARNTGILLSKSEVIAFIDADATPDHKWAEKLLSAWSKHPEADVIGGKTVSRDVHSFVPNFLYSMYYGPADIKGIIGANMSFKKINLISIGLFCDLFDSRGDETFVFIKMGDKRLEIKQNDAIVFHDWPSSIIQWLKERRCNGLMSRLISRVNNDKSDITKKFINNQLLAEKKISRAAFSSFCRI